MYIVPDWAGKLLFWLLIACLVLALIGAGFGVLNEIDKYLHR